MKLGLITWSYRFAMGRKPGDWFTPATMTLEGFVNRASELGLDGIMAERECIADACALRRQAEAKGLYIELGSWGVDALEQDIRLAESLGGKVLRTALGGLRITTWDAEAIKKELKEKTEQIRKALPSLKKHKVKLALENHQDATSEEMIALLKELDSEWVGICVDTGNSLVIMENPYETVEKLAPYAFAVHFKDFKIMNTSAIPSGAKIEGVALGKGGIFDLRRMFRTIHAHAPDVNFTIECQLAPKETVAETLKYEDGSVVDSVRYLKELAKEFR